MESVKILAWDSQHFGFKVGLFTESTFANKNISELIKHCTEKKIKCLYFLADPNCPETAQLAANYGFVMVDIRMTFDRLIHHGEHFNSHSTIRPATELDLPRLFDISRECFNNTRFFYDPHFSKNKSQELYQIWVAESIAGKADMVLLYEEEDGVNRVVSGFITCQKIDQEYGKIGLLAVSKSASGKGVGQQLVKSALDWFNHAGCKTVKVVTQGRNIAAQRCYQSCGFKTEHVGIWYHRWFE